MAKWDWSFKIHWKWHYTFLLHNSFWYPRGFEPIRLRFCVFNFLSILSDFLSREKLTQKWHEPKAEQLLKLQFLNDKIDQSTNFAKLPCAKWLFLYKLQVIYNYSAFGCIYFCISFSHERKCERIERKYKTQNPLLSPFSKSGSFSRTR